MVHTVESKTTFNLPQTLVDAIEYRKLKTGLTKSQIIRQALMDSFGIDDLNKPFTPIEPTTSTTPTK